LIEGKPVKKNVLVATKDFEAGQVIYVVSEASMWLLNRTNDVITITLQEQPVVAVLDADLEGKGGHCSNCLREFVDHSPIRPLGDPLSASYCSEDCQLQAALNHHHLLFGKGAAILETPTLPSDDDTVINAPRAAAQAQLVEAFHTSGKSGLLLVARFIARMVADETRKLAKTGSAPNMAQDEYTLFDHLERLRFLEIADNEWQGQSKLLANALKLAADGLDEFLQNDRYGVLLGKMAYNAIGVTFNEGRSDKVRELS